MHLPVRNAWTNIVSLSLLTIDRTPATEKKMQRRRESAFDSVRQLSVLHAPYTSPQSGRAMDPEGRGGGWSRSGVFWAVETEITATSHLKKAEWVTYLVLMQADDEVAGACLKH